MMRTVRFKPNSRSSKRVVLCLLLTFLTLLAFLPGTPALAQIVRDEYAQAPLPSNTDDALYISQSVPTTMLTGGVYKVYVTMQNHGTTTWKSASGYALGSQAPQDNGTWGGGRVQLPVSILPEEEVTFEFEVTAPSVAGDYRFQWRMLQEGVKWFGAYTPELTITVRDRNNAQPVGQNVPTQMETGKSYDVWVTMFNNGDSTWTRGQWYTLMSRSPDGNTTWGFNRVPLPFDNVAPGQSATFAFPVTAPVTPGTYTFQVSMQREGYGAFGTAAPAVAVNVVAPPPPPPPVNDAEVVDMSVPLSMITGQSYTVAVTMRNNGTTTWAAGVYNLGSLNPTDNLIWGPGRVALATSVAPGQQYTFRFPVTAPATGDYSMQWGMLSNVAWFGAVAIRPVTVTEDLSNVTFIHTDGLGSPVARTDGARTVISRTRYEPYGYVASGATPTIGFTGHVNDADTGLTYMQQRYYDPVAGRFLSIDPVVTDANTGTGFARYTYANASPYKYIDPDGREGHLFWAAPNKVTYTVKYTLSGVPLPFTAAAMNTQIARDFSGVVSVGGVDVTVTAQSVLARACGLGIASVQVVTDTAGVTRSGRSEVDSVGGSFVTLGAGGAQAATPLTASHEIGGHVGGAGDQYAGGVGVNGKILTADVPGPESVMKKLSGQRANQQSLKEIVTAKTNTNKCASGVSAANGGC